MTFSEAVTKTPSIRNHLKPGPKALKGRDRGRISCESRLLRGSVDVDAALRDAFPNAARWDYAIGIKRNAHDSVVWLEVHPASSRHIDDVLNKLRWLKQWLGTSAKELDRLPRRFCWVTTSTVSFNSASPQARRIAEAGLRFPVKHVDLDALV
jgi:hypothetical protein